MITRTIAVVAAFTIGAMILEGVFGVDIGLRDFFESLVRSNRVDVMPQ